MRTRWTFRGAVGALLALTTALAACAPATSPPDPPQVAIDGFETRTREALRLVRRTVRCGDGGGEVFYEARGWTADGAEFVMYRPLRWNGFLVLYAHGYVAPDAPVGLPDPLPPPQLAFRDALVCRGYASAASSYAANGFAVEEGVRDTHLLNALFRSAFDPPEHTMVMGESLGALVTLALAEQYPDVYDGALPMCGIVGGAVPQLGYVGNVALVFRTLYPEVLGPVVDPTDLFDLSRVEGLSVDEIDARIAEAVRADPTGMATMRDMVITLRHPFDPMSRCVAPMPLIQGPPGASLEQEIEALLGPLDYYLVGIEDALTRASGLPFDTSEVTYGSARSAELDYRVELRLPTVQADPAALRYFASHYQPTGMLRVPAITLHNQFDPDAPLMHEAMYRGLVASAGADGQLRSVTLEGSFGHCVFGLDDVTDAIDALSRWIETGVPPAAEGMTVLWPSGEDRYGVTGR